ncbi:MAG TPA: AMP-binding protein [Steroidobacteraceae bacterium]|nr:AMP-binding protein [Steroidobacteraceae bacterium]
MRHRLDLLWRAAETPDAPAIETREVTWGFRELADRASRAGSFLSNRAAQDGSPIALLMPSDERFVAWFHAVKLTGRPVMPLNTRLTAGELAQQLCDARATCLVSDVADDRIAALSGLVPRLEIVAAPDLTSLPDSPSGKTGERRGVAGETRGSGIDDSAIVCAVIFTSGTTGRSKGACLTRANFTASAVAAAERLGPAVAGRWLACMPLFHVGGLSMLVRSVIFGGPVRLLPRFDAALVSDALDAGDVDAVSLVPTMLSRLLAHRGARRAPPGLRVLLLGGASASPDLLTRACALGYPVCPTYGLTEATSQVATAAPPEPGAALPAPVRPLAGVEVRIVDDAREVAPGEPGEILVRGATVTSGYLNDAAATSRAIRDGWLHTGDIGFVDFAGALHVLDRRDDLVVSGGENVYPAEVEAVLLGHPSVADAGVAGLPDADLGARLIAWIVVSETAVADAAALDAHCRRQLAGFKRPREFRFVEGLPRNAAGKLQRRDLAGLAFSR